MKANREYRCVTIQRYDAAKHPDVFPTISARRWVVQFNERGNVWLHAYATIDQAKKAIDYAMDRWVTSAAWIIDEHPARKGTAVTQLFIHGGGES